MRPASFDADRKVRSSAGGRAVIPFLDFGMNSGQIVATVKAVAGAKSYFIRYAVMNGTTPGQWTTIPAVKIQKGDHHFQPDARHDVWVSGAGSGRARLLRLERDRDDHLHLGSASTRS